MRITFFDERFPPRGETIGMWTMPVWYVPPSSAMTRLSRRSWIGTARACSASRGECWPMTTTRARRFRTPSSPRGRTSSLSRDFRALRTWLFSLTHRRAADIRRRRRPTPTDDEILAGRTVDALADPSRVVLEHDLLAALQTTLTSLPWRQRAVWVLREIEELSYDELAEALSMSPDAVRGQLYRARRHVADRMEAWR
ncbi:sigma-70 family RNA polymerase sigma factor [Aeromicrobium piscarium]|uniref:Sigma-70 family RNA polymerase sigma factor n=1 Tax=Aeromicrobium piscarium TaxID=2590901 RepID=A0A554SPU1_9ACTN|nr:sigma-70 family RNA polymerase sigma factor [Aeromicrobium piscarium]